MRPFIYFREYDIMCTTRAALEWQNVEGHPRLVMEGVVLIALFMQMTHIQFYHVIGSSLHRCGVPRTGFGAAITEANLTSAYTGPKLCSQNLPTVYTHSIPPPILSKDSPNCIDDEVVKEMETLIQQQQKSSSTDKLI